MAQHALRESSGGEGSMHTPSNGISGSEATHAPRGSGGGEGNMHTPSNGISGSEATHATRDILAAVARATCTRQATA